MIGVVETRDGRCPIEAVEGDLAALAARIVAVAPRGRLIVVSDDTVGTLYGVALVSELTRLGHDARAVSFPAGEASKSIATAVALWTDLFSHPFDRGDSIIALGGGVTGDLAGFVASTAMRGVRVVQVPTSVLAMCDAAIGGKTGVNVDAGKNLVGTFHHPAAVLCWLPALASLDDREYRSGLAEAVKSALIDGAPSFDAIERDAEALARRDAEAIRRTVGMAAHLKARIVTEDDREQGVRRLLNLGHTFGHAIEHASGYGAWTHGEAVAAGMMAALRFGVDHGLTAPALLERLGRVLTALGLPTSPPALSVAEWVEPMSRDKKRQGEHIRLVLCRAAGACLDHPVTLTALTEWLPALSDSPGRGRSHDSGEGHA